MNYLWWVSDLTGKVIHASPELTYLLGENVLDHVKVLSPEPGFVNPDGTRLPPHKAWTHTLRLLVQDGIDLPVVWEIDMGHPPRQRWCACAVRQRGNMVAVYFSDLTNMLPEHVPQWNARMREVVGDFARNATAAQPTGLEPSPSHERVLPVVSYIGSLGSEESRRTVKSALNNLAHLLGRKDHMSTDWHKLRAMHIERLRQLMAEDGQSPTTIKKKMSFLRGVMKHAFRADLISAEEWAKIQVVDGPRGRRLAKSRVGRAVSVEELAVLNEYMATRRHLVIGVRDEAVMTCGIAGGLRRNEIATLTIGDWDAVQGALRVMGKGNAERLVYLPDHSINRVNAWLRRRGNTHPEAPLFVEVRERGPMVRFGGAALSGNTYYRIVTECMEAAGLERATPHDLRRTYISILLETEKLQDVSQMAGHASAATTELYDRRPEKKRKEIAKRLERLFNIDPHSRPGFNGRTQQLVENIESTRDGKESTIEDAEYYAVAREEADSGAAREAEAGEKRGSSESVPDATKENGVLRTARLGS